MKVLICPDKFRGSLTAREAAEAMARGVRRVDPRAEIVLQPLADGGEGSSALVGELLGLRRVPFWVSGPLREPVKAHYWLGKGRALIEVAEACGLALVPEEKRHPKNTTTIGVGELIDDAVARGAEDVTLFLGGSATNDGGAGMAAALGYTFLGDNEHDFIPMADSLEWVVSVARPAGARDLSRVLFTAVCDVDNPLLGPRGATYTYAPQKGAPVEDLLVLERNMDHFARRIETWLGVNVRDIPGGGAAGGLGAGCVAFLGAQLMPGTRVITDLLGFDELLEGVDLVLTGEGKVDAQSFRGKVVGGVIRRAGPIPVLAFCGTSEVARAGVFSLVETAGHTPEEAMAQPGILLEELVVSSLAAGVNVTWYP